MERPDVLFETRFVSEAERLFDRVREDTEWDTRT